MSVQDWPLGAGNEHVLILLMGMVVSFTAVSPETVCGVHCHAHWQGNEPCIGYTEYPMYFAHANRKAHDIAGKL